MQELPPVEFLEGVPKSPAVGLWVEGRNTMSDRIKIIEAIAHLTAFRKNVREGMYVEARIVQHFHDSLTMLENASGVDMTSFRVPAADIKPKPVGSIHGVIQHSRDNWCDRSLLMMKAQGAENMANMLLVEDEKKIGFGEGVAPKGND